MGWVLTVVVPTVTTASFVLAETSGREQEESSAPVRNMAPVQAVRKRMLMACLLSRSAIGEAIGPCGPEPRKFDGTDDLIPGRGSGKDIITTKSYHFLSQIVVNNRRR